MESEVIKALLIQAPAAAVAVVITVLFLKHLANERQLDRNAESARSVTILQVADSCHDSTRDLAASFQEQIAKMESREEERRRELAAQYDRDRRETASALVAFTSATQAQNAILSANGVTLQAIAGELQKGVHPRIREEDYRKAAGGGA